MESPPDKPKAAATDPGRRKLTRYERQWVTAKHPDLTEHELEALIAEGLPADLPPISRSDLEGNDQSAAENAVAHQRNVARDQRRARAKKARPARRAQRANAKRGKPKKHHKRSGVK